MIGFGRLKYAARPMPALPLAIEPSAYTFIWLDDMIKLILWDTNHLKGSCHNAEELDAPPVHEQVLAQASNVDAIFYLYNMFGRRVVRIVFELNFNDLHFQIGRRKAASLLPESIMVTRIFFDG